MKTLIFGGVPVDVVAWQNAEGPRSQINGGYVFYYTALRALLKYSRYDRFIFVSRREHHRYSFATSKDFTDSGRQVHVVHPLEIHRCINIDTAMLVTTTERLGPMLRLRNMFQQFMPATGFLNATHPTWLGPFLVEMMLSGATANDALICPSDASRKVLKSLMTLLRHDQVHNLSVPCADISTPQIPIGIDCAEFGQGRDEHRKELGYRNDEVILLYCGRFEMSGKCDLGPLLLVVSRLCRSVKPRIRLVLAGCDRKQVSSLLLRCAADFGCASSISIEADPVHARKLALMSAADIFVSPGDGVPESFGITPIEAMASGLPCVVSDWNGYRETVRHGETGFLVPTFWSDLGPCVEAFEACDIDPTSTLAATTVVDCDLLQHYLSVLIENPDRRRMMGGNAREHATATFDWSVIIPQYDNVFDAQLDLTARQETAPGRQCQQLVASTQQLFNHYPTTMVSNSECVCLSEDGRQWVQSLFSLGCSCAELEVINDAVCARIANRVSEEPCQLWTLIEDVARETNSSQWVVRINAMRLLKYGILRRSDAPKPDSLMASREANSSISPSIRHGSELELDDAVMVREDRVAKA